MARLSYAKDLLRLRRIAEGRDAGGQSSEARGTESPALPRSRGETPALDTGTPAGHALAGAETEHYAEVRGHAPEEIDAAGASCASPTTPTEVVIVSPRQAAAGLLPQSQPLAPLLTRVYGEGAALIEAHSVHEALSGTVGLYAGPLSVEQLPLFPGRFRAGPYRLRLALDSPAESVRRLATVRAALEELRREPRALLDSQTIDALVREAVELRRRLGALARYPKGPVASFEVDVHSWIVPTGPGGCWYLLYSPKAHRNALVHFGPYPFDSARPPKDLTVLSGERRAQVLALLLELELLAPTPLAELERRVERVVHHQRSASSVSTSADTGTGPLLALEELRAGIAKHGATRAYLRRQLSSPVLDVACSPSTCDAVLESLLGRLSWLPAARSYHDTESFCAAFEGADQKGRATLLDTLRQAVSLTGAQNRALNGWLASRYEALCVDHGLRFSATPPPE